MDIGILFNWIEQNSLWINIVLALIIIYSNRRRPPRSTMLWVMMIAIFPIIGFFSYLLLGQDTRRRKLFHQKESLDVDVLQHALIKWDEATTHVPLEDEGRFQDYLELIRLNVRMGLTNLSGDNEVEAIFDGRTKFMRLIRDIDEAQEEITFQYYILKSDNLGSIVIEALMRAARRGVKVRVLTDGVGGRDLSKEMRRMMQEVGIQIGIFYPSFLRYINLRLNYRNHRKLCIIDGRVGYIGGMNIALRYVKGDKMPWRDTHLRIVGGAVYAIQKAFLIDWYFVDRTLITDHAYYPEPDSRIDNNCLAQIVTSSPVQPWPDIMQGYVRILLEARRYVYMETPYFLPTEPILFAMRTAALAGVDVRLMIPMRTDAKLVEWASISYVMETLEAGVKVHLYQAGFNHSKMLVSDDFLCSCGSSNIDFRSFENNFESNAFFYDSALALRMKKVFLDDLQQCVPIEKVQRLMRRPFLLRLWESIIRLLSPLL